MKRQQKIPALNFELIVDGKPVEVIAKPYMAANEQARFRVSYNGGPVHIFGYDENMDRIVVMDSASAIIKPSVEQAIGEALMLKLAA